ncbi:MAG: hypothetical protein LIR50_15285 [Bacillota bacterium]|nr:hypothetical protein [Bacillota bacterium]
MNTINNILSPTGVPISRLNYAGSEDPYITFFFYGEQGEAFADDKETSTGYYLQVDIWTKGNFTALANQVKSLMEDADFKRIYSTELHESDTGLNHKVLRFSHYEENS